MQINIAAKYHPGYSRESYAWRASVSTDGGATLEVKSSPGMFAENNWVRRSISPPSHQHLRVLFETVASANLCSLNDRYSPTYRPGDVITDLSTLELELAVDGRRCRVSVYGGDLTLRVDGHPHKAAVRRFCAAWSRFLTVVPSPNRWQTPDTCT